MCKYFVFDDYTRLDGYLVKTGTCRASPGGLCTNPPASERDCGWGDGVSKLIFDRVELANSKT